MSYRVNRINISPLAAWNGFKQRPLDFIGDLTRSGGDLTLVRLGPKQVCFVSHRDLVEELLLERASEAVRPPPMQRILAEASGGESLFTITGKTWEERRALVASAFGRREVESRIDEVRPVVEEELAGWPLGSEFAIAPAIRRLTLRVALQYVFGVSEGTAELADRLAPSFDNENHRAAQRIFSVVPTPGWIPTPANRSHARHLALLRSSVDELVEMSAPSALPRTLFQSDRGEQTYRGADWKTELLGLMFAGHETTASALMWAIVEAGQRRTVWDDVATDPTLATHVVDESMRLHPPVWGLLRVAQERLSLGGESFRRGTIFIVPIVTIHRAADLWDDGEGFCPERFAGQRPAPAAYLPFGLGPRRCIGGYLAVAELIESLSAIARRFLIEDMTPAQPGYAIRMALRCDPEPIVVLGAR